MNYHPTLYSVLRLSFICPPTIHLFSSYSFSFTQWIFSYPFILVTSSILYYSSLSAYFYPCLSFYILLLPLTYPSFIQNVSFLEYIVRQFSMYHLFYLKKTAFFSMYHLSILNMYSVYPQCILHPSSIHPQSIFLQSIYPSSILNTSSSYIP